MNHSAHGITAFVGAIAAVGPMAPAAIGQGSCIPQFVDRILGTQEQAYDGVPDLSLDGSTLAIGSADYGTAGRVRVFRHQGTSWQLDMTLQPSIAYANAHYGFDVSFGGNDRLVVSAPGERHPNPILPITYVYERTPSGWFEAARLTAWGAAGTSDWFGWAVAISATGDTIVIGEPYKEHSGAIDGGAAYVFDRDPATGTWIPGQILTVTDPAGLGGFGWSVAVDALGDTILVGVLVGGTSGEGAAFVFVRTPNGWIEETRLPISLSWWDSYYGYSVALNASGDAAVVGAPQDYDLGYRSGAAFAYRRTPSGWVEEAKLHGSDEGALDGFGWSVVMNASGDRIHAGALFASSGAIRPGAAYVFDRGGIGWMETAKLTAPNGQQSDGFGVAIGSTFEGSRVAIAATSDDTAATDAGAVYILESPCSGPQTFCTAKQNSLGCWPVMRFNGHPSAWDGSAFELHASRVLNQKLGWLVYSVSGRAALPFGGGTLCMNAPIRRTPIQSSGGSPPWDRDCSGSFSFDFNEWVASDVDAALHVGARVEAQFISRDPAATYGLSLTDAVEFIIEP